MSKRAFVITSFILGLVALVVFTGITLGNWGELVNSDENRNYLRILFSLIAVFTVVLLILGVFFREKDRWLSFTLAALLITGFSMSYFYSIGPLLAPIGIVLLVISVFKLARYEGR
ncbi:hypothetical protein Dehly_1545 [Dehalogenimonas lykanthroporepellens BL-DC-9]|nr:hypothetical protein Dehly_1545 [Dehalogenimonas lykanthroporepellens BL-DC-9]